MASEKTRADSVRFYNSGASADGNAQADPDASLGNFRSSTEVAVLDAAIQNPISDITLDLVAGANGEGAGSLTASGVDDLKWTPPGGTQGNAVTILNGETKIIEGGGGEPEKYVRVTRTTATAHSGTATLTLTTTINNVVGFDDVSSAEQTAGDTEYRCLALKNDSTSTVKSVKVKVRTLGTQRTTDTAQLPATGLGTIQTTGSFADWPDVGYALVKDSGGTLREIVYYESRTATTLTIPANGRGLLGTTAAAGTATDTADAIPGIAIGIEAPTSQPSGSFTDNTGVGEGTAPGGVSFSTPITDANALSIGDLTAGYIYAVWIKRQIPATAQAQSGLLNDFEIALDAA